MAVSNFGPHSVDVNRPDRRRDGSLLSVDALKHAHTLACEIAELGIGDLLDLVWCQIERYRRELSALPPPVLLEPPELEAQLAEEPIAPLRGPRTARPSAKGSAANGAISCDHRRRSETLPRNSIDRRV